MRNWKPRNPETPLGALRRARKRGQRLLNESRITMKNTTKVHLLKKSRVLPSDRAEFDRLYAAALARGENNKHARKAALKKTATPFYQLRWFDSAGKPVTESLGKCSEITRKQAEDARVEKQTAIGSGQIRADKARPMTLKQFAEFYRDRRSQTNGDHIGKRGHRRGFKRLDVATLREHDMAFKYLTAHFGDDRLISKIDDDEVEGWLDALESGELAKVRAGRTREKTIRANTVKKHIRSCKVIFNYAKTAKLVTANPFDEFSGSGHKGEPNPYISTDDVERVIATVPRGWKVLFALCRYAGLRRGEALSLPWAGQTVDRRGKTRWIGVDWEAGKLHVVSEKSDGIFRIVPICPRLNEILTEAFHNAPEGTQTACGLSEHNLTTFGKRHVHAAGLTPWRKLYQSLRSSCENDWKQAGIAEATYTAWAGHAEEVSREHYVCPTEAEFATITKREPPAKAA